jgi:hypothetical protein
MSQIPTGLLTTLPRNTQDDDTRQMVGSEHHRRRYADHGHGTTSAVTHFQPQPPGKRARARDDGCQDGSAWRQSGADLRVVACAVGALQKVLCQLASLSNSPTACSTQATMLVVHICDHGAQWLLTPRLLTSRLPREFPRRKRCLRRLL